MTDTLEPFVNHHHRRRLLLPALLCVCGVANGSEKVDAPPQRFDASRWKLTLPIDADRTHEGHAAEVSASKLAAGFEDVHFRVDAKGTLHFWCPVRGARTEGTKYPRTELREMLKPGDVSVNWGAKGTHRLTARCRVLQVPGNPKVVIGQIHGYSGRARPLIKLQYFKGRIEALVKESPIKGRDIKLTWPDVGLNRDIAYEIELRDGRLSITVNGTTKRQNIAENDPRWMDQTFYFKAGVYPQDNDGPATEGARVEFSRLAVHHE